MQSNRHHPYESQVFNLYNTLKLLETPEKRAKHLADQTRMPNGTSIIEGALALFVAKLHMAQNDEWERRCNLPEYPGNQEDVVTINYIESLAAQIKKKFAPVYSYLTKIITELCSCLNRSAAQSLTELHFMAHIHYRNLLNIHDQTDRIERIRQIAIKNDGIPELQQTAELLKANRWATRKALWDKNQSLVSLELSQLDVLICEIASVLKGYQPGFYAKNGREGSPSIGSQNSTPTLNLSHSNSY